MTAATPPERFNVYGDESCHLERDGHEVMVIGAIVVPVTGTRRIASSIRDLKERHGLNRRFEVKWTKVSPGLLDFYKELVDLFLAEEALSFRGYVVHDKSKLRHDAFRQDHDDFYHKTYFGMLKPVLTAPGRRFRIYIDIKSTRGAQKAEHLHDVLTTALHDPFHRKVEGIQIVRSHEVEFMQLADLLIGAVGRANREGGTSAAKAELVAYVQGKTNLTLRASTRLAEGKFNLFHWTPQAVR